MRASSRTGNGPTNSLALALVQSLANSLNRSIARTRRPPGLAISAAPGRLDRVPAANVTAKVDRFVWFVVELCILNAPKGPKHAGRTASGRSRARRRSQHSNKVAARIAPQSATSASRSGQTPATRQRIAIHSLTHSLAHTHRAPTCSIIPIASLGDRVCARTHFRCPNPASLCVCVCVCVCVCARARHGSFRGPNAMTAHHSCGPGSGVDLDRAAAGHVEVRVGVAAGVAAGDQLSP